MSAIATALVVGVFAVVLVAVVVRVKYRGDSVDRELRALIRHEGRNAR